MEYVKGTELREQFESFRKVPANQLLKWASQICHALQGLHTLSEPVLHRDLKPENILLGTDLRVRVIDFGLAAKMVKHGFVPGVAGTLDYMSPETTQGESVLASDVYSIGLILYEGLTGRRPFAHLIPPIGMPEILYNTWLYNQKRAVRPDPPSSLNNTVTHALDALVLRCLEFDPGNRYHHAGELLEALRAVIDEPPLEKPDVVYLKEGYDLKNRGNLDSACRAFQRGLDAPPSSRETSFALLWGSGEVLGELGRYNDAVDRLVRAWKLTEILPFYGKGTSERNYWGRSHMPMEGLVTNLIPGDTKS